MRALAPLALVVFAAVGVASADTVAVLVFQDGRPNALALEDQEKVGRLAVEMLASASYEAVQAVAEQGWLDGRRRPHLYVTFIPPRPVRFLEEEAQAQARARAGAPPTRARWRRPRRRLPCVRRT